MDQNGNIRVITPAEAQKDPVKVHVALIQQGNLSPAAADAAMVKAGMGDDINSSTITQVAKGVGKEVKKQLKFAAKTAAVVVAGAGAGAAVVAVAGTGLVAVAVAGAAGGVASQGTSDVIEGHRSGVGSYVVAAGVGALGGAIAGVVGVGGEAAAAAGGAEAGETGVVADSGVRAEVEAEASQAAQAGARVPTQQTPRSVTRVESPYAPETAAGPEEATKSAAPITDTQASPRRSTASDTPRRIASGAPTSPVINPSEVAGKTPAEIDALARERGLIPKGPDPMKGNGAYVDPVTGKQRILINPNEESPHVHVNDSTGNRLDINGNVIDRRSPGAHLQIGVDDQ